MPGPVLSTGDCAVNKMGVLTDKVAEKTMDTQLAGASWELSTYCAPGPVHPSPPSCWMVSGSSCIRCGPQ